MINNLKILFLILLILSVSRLLPHAPNFTVLIAISFYVPALIGITYLPAVILGFIFTDVILGFHNTVLFTWGSILLIGLTSIYLNNSLKKRITGVLVSVFIFFILSNFGVWFLGNHNNLELDLFNTYVLGLPFFFNSLVSTIFYSSIIEIIYRLFKFKYIFSRKNNSFKN